MSYNKIIYGGEVLIDLTEDTVNENSLLKGFTAHKADGTIISGTYDDNIDRILMSGLTDGYKTVLDDGTIISVSNASGMKLTKTFSEDLTTCTAVLVDVNGMELGRTVKDYSNNSLTISIVDHSGRKLVKTFAEDLKSLETVLSNSNDQEIARLNKTYLDDGKTVESNVTYSGIGIDPSPQYDTGYTAGKNDTMTQWWEMIMAKNTPANTNAYHCTFREWHIKVEFFRPPATMLCKGDASNLFYGTTSDGPIDMQALEEELGYPILDTTGMTRCQYMFSGFSVSTLGVIDLSSCTASQACWYMFYNPAYYTYRISSIKKLIMSKNTDVQQTFRYATGLVHCIFEGEIGKSGLDLSYATLLDHESLMSMINCLYDYSSSGTTYTVTLGATNLAKLTAAEKKIATDKGWTLA